MYYLIECTSDDSYCVVLEEDIVYDNVLKKGDEVVFFYPKKEFRGIITEHSSENADALLDTAKEKKKKEMKMKRSQDDGKGARSSRKIPASRSDDHVPKKKHKSKESHKKKERIAASIASNEEIMKLIDASRTEHHCPNKIYTSSDDSDGDADKAETSPEILISAPNIEKAVLLESPKQDDAAFNLRKNNDGGENTDITKGSVEVEAEGMVVDGKKPTAQKTSSDNNENVVNSEDEADDEQQMFGKHWKEDKMVHLCHNVYIKKRVLDIACNGAKRPSHLLHRLVEGVFKPEGIINCTITGQPPKAQGKERQSAKYYCLNAAGKNAIKMFVSSKCVEKKWPIPDEKEVDRILTQRLGEIKREYLSNNPEQGK